MRQEIREILASVGRPFRYAGGEAGQLKGDWDRARVRVCLAFPEVYEIGMSHLGLGILYHLLNGIEGILAERAFAPWEDMEAELRARRIPLFTLESHRPIRDFDILGISLAYELTYANVLNMLSLSGIPLRAAERGEGDPIVIAGGPCAFNPEPVAPFFDVVVIGDGEATVVRLAGLVEEGKRKKLSREEMIKTFDGIEGVYLPDRERSGPVGMARVCDLAAAPFPKVPLSAYSATQERVAVEVARGCARGCRFCQAGYVYRPVRQRESEDAVAYAVEGVRATGREDFSFLSLSISDWSPLEGALKSVHEGCGEIEVSAGLPSLRAEALTDGITGAMGRARSAPPATQAMQREAKRAGSFTLAPEAATERMRRFINKGNTDDDLYASAEKVFAGGWQAIKLYFMLGLPGETEEEVEGIVRMANRCLDIGRKYNKRPNVTVSTSTFVPKPHTPFQWEGQISIERTLDLQRRLKRTLRRPGLFYRWHKAEMSFLEGVLARGGRELADVIERAFEKGARFDGWDEHFDLSRWRESCDESGIDPESYLEPRDLVAAMPWESLGAGPSREFLLRERERASSLDPTPDCTRGECSNCGVCDFKELKNRIAQATRETTETTNARNATGCDPRVANHGCRYRIQFTKTEGAAFLGQVETLDAVRRALRAAGLPLAYTEGYHPRAKVSSGPALPVGVESVAEYIDVEMRREFDPETMISSISERLPEGMEVVGARALEPKSPSIDDATDIARYEVYGESAIRRASEAIDRFKSSRNVIFTRMRREKRVDVDLKEYVAGLASAGRGVLGIGVRNLRPALKVSEILGAVFGIPDEDARKLHVRKVAVEWK